MTVPLYSYDSAFLGIARERNVLKLERDGLAKVIRHKKGLRSQIDRCRGAATQSPYYGTGTKTITNHSPLP
jgi:hypothetical protein